MSVRKFSTLDDDMMSRWCEAAENENIPPESFEPRIRIINGEGELGYSFGLIFNENRLKKPVATVNTPVEECRMCSAVEIAKRDKKRNLDPENQLPGFIVTINKFPFLKGFSLAISDPERPPYSTANLNGISDEIQKILAFSQKRGFEILHNSVGFGASQPRHEHYHLATFRVAYDMIGKTYGFDAAIKENSKKSKDVKVMPGFPFAHLIFDSKDPERLVSFLSKLEKEIGHRYEDRKVPHIISEGFDGLLVVPGRKYHERSKSSAEFAGHYLVKSMDEFQTKTYNQCMDDLGKLVFTKNEIDLEALI